MKNSEFKRLLARMNKLQTKIDSASDDMAKFFQPYFNDKIFVLYQPSDGFVVFYDSYFKSNLNESVSTVYKNIKDDPDFYKNKT